MERMIELYQRNLDIAKCLLEGTVKALERVQDIQRKNDELDANSKPLMALITEHHERLNTMIKSFNVDVDNFKEQISKGEA